MTDRKQFVVALLALTLALAGCIITPTNPPTLDLPATSNTDPALERWWVGFGDPDLNALEDEALAANLDLRAAIARIDLARSAVLLAQTDLYPNIKLDAGGNKERSTTVGTNPLPPGFSPLTKDYRVAFDASYELDLWGKYRNNTRAAQNDLLASQYAREIVRTTVAAQVAQTYFSLLATDAQLKLLQDTLGTREETVKLQKDRLEGGVIGQFEFSQAEAERAAVVADIAVTKRAIAQYESALAVLLGRSPKDVYTPIVKRDVEVARLLAVPTIPEGLPSDILERRPDIKSVEKELAAADIRIDVARADYFPKISLTGSYGTEAGALANLFSGPSLIWALAGTIAQQVIGVRAITANVEAKTANRDLVTVQYVQTVQAAFKDVHDALAANQNTRDALAAQTVRADKLNEALGFANDRYISGYSAYLEVLDTQRTLLQAQTLQIVAARDVRLATIDLAKALGGGWEYKTAVSER
jgi:multidrug efflux system outer membrane protein